MRAKPVGRDDNSVIRDVVVREEAPARDIDTEDLEVVVAHRSGPKPLAVRQGHTRSHELGLVGLDQDLKCDRGSLQEPQCLAFGRGS